MSAITKRLAQALVDHAIQTQLQPPDKPPEEPPPTVGQWLERATAAHLMYRKDLQLIAPSASTRLIPPSLEEAANCRAQAELLDPDHLDPAWLTDGSTNAYSNGTHDEFHEPMLRFYVRELGLPEPAPRSADPHPTRLVLQRQSPSSKGVS